VEATLGFGATVITVALGSFVLPIDALLPAFVPLNVFLSLYLTVRYARDVDTRLLFRRVVPFMALGLPVGVYLLRSLSGPGAKRAFGAFVVVLSAVELVRAFRRTSEEAPARAPSPVLDSLLLLLGGVVHGAFATGGPMAVYVAGHALPDKTRFRSTLSALWLVLNLFLVASYAVVGSLTAERAKLTASLGLPLLAGMAVGEWAHRRFSGPAFRTAIFVLLAIAGSIMLVRG
jgi:uncharacterized protein